MLINVKIPTIVDNLTFISNENLKSGTVYIFQHSSSYEQLKFHTQLCRKKDPGPPDKILDPNMICGAHPIKEQYRRWRPSCSVDRNHFVQAW